MGCAGSKLSFDLTILLQLLYLNKDQELKVFHKGRGRGRLNATL